MILWEGAKRTWEWVAQLISVLASRWVTQVNLKTRGRAQDSTFSINLCHTEIYCVFGERGRSRVVVNWKNQGGLFQWTRWELSWWYSLLNKGHVLRNEKFSIKILWGKLNVHSLLRRLNHSGSPVVGARRCVMVCSKEITSGREFSRWQKEMYLLTWL